MVPYVPREVHTERVSLLLARFVLLLRAALFQCVHPLFKII